MDILPDFSNVRWKHVLEPLNFAEVLRRLAAETPNTMLDDILANQFADALQQTFLSLFDGSAPPVDAATFATFAAMSPDEKRKRIDERAKAAGVSLSPILVTFLIQFAWPYIERFLGNLFSRKAA